MCPKISRRSAPGSHQKQSKRPKFFRRYAPGDSPPDFPTHIKYVSYSPVLQPGELFPFLLDTAVVERRSGTSTEYKVYSLGSPTDITRASRPCGGVQPRGRLGWIWWRHRTNGDDKGTRTRAALTCHPGPAWHCRPLQSVLHTL